MSNQALLKQSAEDEGGSPELKPPSSPRVPSMRFSTVLVIALSLSAFALAQERKIQRAELPPAVEKTVATESRGATILGSSQETEHGETYYEAEMMVSGHSKDVLLDKGGSIVEVEEQIAFKSLPSEVKEGFLSKAGSGKILKVESLTKHGKLVAYEAKIISNHNKMREIQLGPDGNALGHEE